MNHFEFETSEFRDDAAARARRVNDSLGGFALASWLAAELRARGVEASAPWEEDHGCDFSIEIDGGRWLCVCCLEDDAADAEFRTGHVGVDRLRTLVDRLRELFAPRDVSPEKRLHAILTEILATSPALRNLQAE